MKRLKFTLKFFGGCLLVLVVLFIYVINWGSKRALDYKIDDISMERVVLDDSACYEHQHYLVSLTISPVHYKYGFWEGSARPIGDGCVDSILDISIESNSHERLDDYILNAELIRDYSVKELSLFTDTIHKAMSSRNNLQDIKERLQKSYPHDILISIDSLSPQPQYVVLRFADREIRKVIK